MVRCGQRSKAEIFSQNHCFFVRLSVRRTGKPNLGFFKQATKILSNGGVVCIFSEGFVNPRKYGFFDFKASYILLAEKSDAKILPIYLYPDLTVFKRSRIYIGTPVSRQKYGKYTDKDEASTYIQSMIMEYASEID